MEMIRFCFETPLCCPHCWLMAIYSRTVNHINFGWSMKNCRELFQSVTIHLIAPLSGLLIPTRHPMVHLRWNTSMYQVQLLCQPSFECVFLQVSDIPLAVHMTMNMNNAAMNHNAKSSSIIGFVVVAIIVRRLYHYYNLGNSHQRQDPVYFDDDVWSVGSYPLLIIGPKRIKAVDVKSVEYQLSGKPENAIDENRDMIFESNSCFFTSKFSLSFIVL